MMSPPAPREPVSLPPVFRRLLIAAALFWLACLGAEAFCRFVLHFSDYHYLGLTFRRKDNFADIGILVLRFRHFHSPDFFSDQWQSHFLYPAPASWFYWVGLHLLRKPISMLLCIVLASVAPAVWFFKALQRQGLSRNSAALFAGGMLVTSYPLFFEINRGNIEVFIWLLAASGVFALLRDKPWLAALLIGVAGACKGYPFLYLALFLPKRKYLEAIFSIAIGIAVNLFSLWAITDNFALGKAGVAAGVEEFRQNYILSYNSTGLDHSMFGFYKRFAPVLPPRDVLAHGLNLYLGVAALIALLVYFLWVIRLPLLNQVLFLTVMAITLPPTSYDYTLVHLYTGFALLVFVAIRAWKAGGQNPRGLAAVFVCYAVLLTPQNEVILHGDRLEGQIKCVVLIALAVIATLYPFPDTTLPSLEA